MTADDVLKRHKETRHSDPRYCRCGRELMPRLVVEGSEDWKAGEILTYETRCSICLVKSLNNWRGKPVDDVKRPAPLCRWCWKSKKLVGAWCRTCRDKYQRRVIKAALDKVKTGTPLSWEDEQTLSIAPYWQVWKKMFPGKRR